MSHSHSALIVEAAVVQYLAQGYSDKQPLEPGNQTGRPALPPDTTLHTLSIGGRSLDRLAYPVVMTCAKTDGC